jgi:DNA invertase Pin-like site-specific DNA recombinase
MKYAIYLRVSTDKQDQRSQLDICLNYIRANHTGEFDYAVFTDSISSRVAFAKRQGLQSALNSLQENDYMIALRADRVTRDPEELGHLMQSLREKEASLDLAEQPGLPGDELMFPIYIALAKQEVKLTRQRINNALAAKKARGEMTGRCPYGYTLDPNNLITSRDASGKWEQRPGFLIEEPREQEALKIMENWFDWEYSFGATAKELTRLGYLNRFGNPFDKSTIRQILLNRGKSKASVQAPSDRGGCLLPSRK